MEEWQAAVQAVWEEIETVRDFIRACQKFDHTGPHDSDQSWAARLEVLSQLYTHYECTRGPGWNFWERVEGLVTEPERVAVWKVVERGLREHQRFERSAQQFSTGADRYTSQRALLMAGPAYFDRLLIDGSGPDGENHDPWTLVPEPRLTALTQAAEQVEAEMRAAYRKLRREWKAKKRAAESWLKNQLGTLAQPGAREGGGDVKKPKKSPACYRPPAGRAGPRR